MHEQTFCVDTREDFARKLQSLNQICYTVCCGAKQGKHDENSRWDGYTTGCFLVSYNTFCKNSVHIKF